MGIRLLARTSGRNVNQSNLKVCPVEWDFPDEKYPFPVSRHLGYVLCDGVGFHHLGRNSNYIVTNSIAF